MSQSNSQTCIICESQYSTIQKSHITELMQKEQIAIKHYPQTCLSCIMCELHQEKSQYLPNLKSVTNDLKAARKAYQKATQAHHKISAKYTYYDRQANYIQFFISQAAATKVAKPAAKARVRVKQPTINAAKQADIIAALLDSLTPAQQKLVLAKAIAAEEIQLASTEVL